MAETKKDIWAELRKPFPKEAVGKLPKGGITLDYIGHAAVTDRLNTVDPTWTWEPFATDEQGLPLMTAGEPQFGKPTKGLWIRLTINGVTRPGYGDGKTEKEAIGDALRNAAMRFGVALELWTRDELESNVSPGKPIEKKIIKTVEDAKAILGGEVEVTLTDIMRQARELMRQKNLHGITAKTFISGVIGKDVPETVEEYQELIMALEAIKDGMD